MTAYAQGVDVILNGHDHDYERFNKKTPSGAYADDGIREFVVGTGGVATRPFDSTVAGSQKRITGNSHWGVLRLDLWTKSYSWRFVDADSAAVLDSGSTSCHS
jgi:alkaline phosphatase